MRVYLTYSDMTMILVALLMAKHPDWGEDDPVNQTYDDIINKLAKYLEGRYVNERFKRY